MSFDLGSVLSDGLERSFTRAGAIAIGIHTVLYSLLATGLLVAYVGAILFENEPALLLVVLVAALVGTVAIWAALAWAYAGTARWLVRPEEARSTTPRSALTRRAILATATIMLLNLGLGVAVAMGSAAFVLPGFAIGTVMIFAPLAVAVEDAGPIAAMSRSWQLTRGHRLELFVIGFLYNAVFWWISQAIGILAIIPVIGWIGLGAFWAAQTVVSVGILAEAYVQITENERADHAETGAARDEADGRDETTDPAAEERTGRSENPSSEDRSYGTNW